jgi:hypothetical protein
VRRKLMVKKHGVTNSLAAKYTKHQAPLMKQQDEHFTSTLRVLHLSGNILPSK